MFGSSYDYDPVGQQYVTEGTDPPDSDGSD